MGDFIDHHEDIHLSGPQDIYVTLSLYCAVCLCVIWIIILITWWICKDSISSVLLKDSGKHRQGV